MASNGVSHLCPQRFEPPPQSIANVINEPFAAGVIYPTILATWTFFALAFAWPDGNPYIPILVLAVGFAGTLGYDLFLKKSLDSL